MTTATPPSAPLLSPQRMTVIIVAACLIAMVGFGIRSSLGLFLEPITSTRGWTRETFGLALAIQNLLWGLGLPVAGALADRFGPARVIVLGTLIYGAGIWGMGAAETEQAFHLFAGVLTGLGVAFTAFTLALAAIARVVGPERRSLALGLGTAAGSFGQAVFSPLGQSFIASFGWQQTLSVFMGIAIFMIPLALMLPNEKGAASGTAEAEQTMGEALREALAHQGYVLLTVGFFVCGFHVAFITVHFPAYTRDLGMGPEVGAYCLALIGLFNIAGSFLSGAVGQRFPKHTSLCAIYFLRAVVITCLLIAPKTALTLYLFAGAMGILWLSTVPLTTGIVAQIFGVRYMATLFGVVFLSHQIGSFLGVWLGGYLYDTTGSYDPVWYAAIVLGLLAAIIHWPIDERPISRPVEALT